MSTTRAGSRPGIGLAGLKPDTKSAGRFQYMRDFFHRLGALRNPIQLLTFLFFDTGDFSMGCGMYALIYVSFMLPQVLYPHLVTDGDGLHRVLGRSGDGLSNGRTNVSHAAHGSIFHQL